MMMYFRKALGRYKHRPATGGNCINPNWIMFIEWNQIGFSIAEYVEIELSCQFLQ